MKIIFLETEGVLFHQVSRVLARLTQEPEAVHKPSVEALNKIITATKAKIVVTAALRSMGMGILESRFKAWGIAQGPIDVTPATNNKLEALLGWFALVKVPGTAEHGFGKIDSFIILDPEPLTAPSLAPNFIQINRDRGLTDELADKAIAFLTNTDSSLK